MNNFKPLVMAAVALLAVAAPAQAGKSDAANEVTLHIDAEAAIPPDRAELAVTLSGSGATRNDAIAALRAKQDAFAKSLGDVGLGSAKVTASEPVKVDDATDDMAMDVVAADAAGDAAAAACDAAAVASPKGRKLVSSCTPKKPAFTLQATTTVVFDDLTQLDKAQSVAATVGWSAYRFGYGMHYTTADPAAASKAAREQAIAKARKDADDYAASLGYHVVRIIRVSNASPAFGMRDLHNLTTYADMAPSRMTPSYFGAATYVSVGMDFVIAPN